ncbi:MAG: hypothetical protein WC608_05900 [Parcubacteria group bacterium]
MQYYHDIITEKSFEFLQELKKKFNFVLIGGWAVFLYARTLKSKDIDIIVDYLELGKLKEEYEVVKNDRLKKYEIKTGEFDLDIYLPHYSELGVDLDELQQTAVNKEGFKLPAPEMLFLLKLYAWSDRQGSAKGEKDKLDIFSLATLPEFDWAQYLRLVKKYNLKDSHAGFIRLLKNTVELKELEFNQQKMAKFKKGISGKLKK